MGEDIYEEAHTVANEHSAKGKFSLIERLRGRNMPTDDVTIYLDEGAAWRRDVIKELLGDEKDPDKVKALEAELAEVTQAILDSAVVIHVEGISSKEYDALLAEAEESYPTEYEEFQSPLTGQKMKNPIENEERDLMFDVALLAACVRSAEIDGFIDEDITREWIAEFKELAPLDGVRKLVSTVFKMRMASAWMDEIQNEDFSPRP